jgi:hypothetical protein
VVVPAVVVVDGTAPVGQLKDILLQEQLLEAPV